VQAIVFDKLAGALGLDAGELVSIVGAGARQRPCSSLPASFRRATSGLWLRPARPCSSVSWPPSAPSTWQQGKEQVSWLPTSKMFWRLGGLRAVAESLGDAGKVVGFVRCKAQRTVVRGPGRLSDRRGRRQPGLALQSFRAHEPQVPAAATTVVVMAGLDALGVTISEGQVHRAHLLASLLDIPLGSVVTARVLADGLSAQIAQLRGTTRRGSSPC